MPHIHKFHRRPNNIICTQIVCGKFLDCRNSCDRARLESGFVSVWTTLNLALHIKCFSVSKHHWGLWPWRIPGWRKRSLWSFVWNGKIDPRLKHRRVSTWSTAQSYPLTWSHFLCNENSLGTCSWNVHTCTESMLTTQKRLYILCLETQMSCIPAIPINTLLSFVWPPRFRRLLWSNGLVRQDLLSLKVAGFCDESFLTIGKAGFDCSGAFTSIFGADPTLFQGLRVPVFSLRATVLGWIRQRQRPTDRHMAGGKGGPRREDWRVVELVVVYWFYKNVANNLE